MNLQRQTWLRLYDLKFEIKSLEDQVSRERESQRSVNKFIAAGIIKL